MPAIKEEMIAKRKKSTHKLRDNSEEDYEDMNNDNSYEEEIMQKEIAEKTNQEDNNENESCDEDKLLNGTEEVQNAENERCEEEKN